MNEYRVIITETLKRAVTVEAESREEAEEAVRRQYQNSEHILVAEDFDGVSFSAKYPEQQVELPYAECGVSAGFRSGQHHAVEFRNADPAESGTQRPGEAGGASEHLSGADQLYHQRSCWLRSAALRRRTGAF